MKKGIVAVCIALGAISVTASPAVAQPLSCPHPGTPPSPTAPISYVLWHLLYADYMVCVITH